MIARAQLSWVLLSSDPRAGGARKGGVVRGGGVGWIENVWLLSTAPVWHFRCLLLFLRRFTDAYGGVVGSQQQSNGCGSTNFAAGIVRT